MEPKPTESIDEILQRFPDTEMENLIPILQAVQEHFGYIPALSIERIGRYLKMPTSKVYGTASFYDEFRFKPKGKYHIRICKGTACHLISGNALIQETENRTRVKQGDISKDGLFSQEETACMGACGNGPMVEVNGIFYNRMNPEKMGMLIEELKKNYSSIRKAI